MPNLIDGSPNVATTTKSTTNTKLALATAALVLSAGLAFAAAPLSSIPKDILCTDSITFEKQCNKTGYNYAVFICSDGTKITRSEKTCLTAKQWDSYSVKLCKPHCKAAEMTKKNLNSSSGQAREICNDSQDNDGDQLIDCADNECNSASNCTSASITEIEETPSTAVIFTDANLEHAIREAINKPNGYILKSEVSSINELHLNDKGITNLQGLEEFRQLADLDLNNNQISDISPIANLTNLIRLKLDNNQITSLNQLPQVSRLEELSARHNQLSSVDIRGVHSGLKRLYLSDNHINDLSGFITSLNLFAFPMLEEIYLDNNQISSLRPFGGVQTIKKLNLANNSISDISPLDSFLHITYIDLTNDPITSIERMIFWNSLQTALIGGTALDGAENCTIIDNLRSRGVRVVTDNRINNILCE